MTIHALLLFPFFTAVSLANSESNNSQTNYTELNPQRIQEISTYLSENPQGFGKPISDRTYWKDPNRITHLNNQITQAEALLDKLFPAWNENAYLEFSKTGQRDGGQKMMGARSSWLQPLTIAECLENKGRFLPLINKILEEYVIEPTWIMPAHDKGLGGLRGKYDVDLGSSSFGESLGESLYLLGDKIQPQVRADVQQALESRLFVPFQKALHGGKTCYWLGSKKKPKQNNWNPVCLDGVVGAALATIPDKTQRAMYVAAAEHYSPYFLNSIGADGYDTEGVSYWGYGFSHYIALRQKLIEVTSGKIDIFADPHVRNLVLYGIRVRIGPHAIPPFGDCPFGITPATGILSYCNEAMSLGLPFPKFPETEGAELMEVTPVASTTERPPVKEDLLRSFFKDAGVLCCRPVPGSSCQLGIGIKAGGNFSHSHNDIGSYAIAIGDEEPTGDPGGPKNYTRATFGPERLTYKLLNSYGHPVPVIAGKLQIDATQAHPKILNTQFTETQDSMTIDMKPAYDAPELKSLTRQMVYDRSGMGQVEITDDFNFNTPSTFEDTLITHGKWKQVDDKTIELTRNRAKLLVHIETPNGYTVKSETIRDMGYDPFTRLGLVLNGNLKAGKVTMTFHPKTL
jgi:hypothetical protein